MTDAERELIELFVQPCPNSSEARTWEERKAAAVIKVRLERLATTHPTWEPELREAAYAFHYAWEVWSGVRDRYTSGVGASTCERISQEEEAKAKKDYQSHD